MAREARYLHARAAAIAEDIVHTLMPACEQILIAGSIRRRVPYVKDIEIVAEPLPRKNLFGEEIFDDLTELDLLLRKLTVPGEMFEPRETKAGVTRMGLRYKALVHRKSTLPVDLFIVRPPAQWGAVLAIRTGPAEFSKHLVTECQKRGLRCEDGRLRHGLKTVPTPTEERFIRACGVEYVEPEKRDVRA